MAGTNDGSQFPDFSDSTGMLDMQIVPHDDAGKVVVTMDGQIATENSREVTDAFKNILSVNVPPKQLLVDMAGLTYVSSAGIGAFIGLLVDCRKQDVTLELHNVSERVRHVFDVLGFGTTFHFK